MHRASKPSGKTILRDLGGILSSYGGARLESSRFWQSISPFYAVALLYFASLKLSCAVAVFLGGQLSWSMLHEIARHDQMAGGNTTLLQSKRSRSITALYLEL